MVLIISITLLFFMTWLLIRISLTFAVYGIGRPALIRLLLQYIRI